MEATTVEPGLKDSHFLWDGPDGAGTTLPPVPPAWPGTSRDGVIGKRPSVCRSHLGSRRTRE